MASYLCCKLVCLLVIMGALLSYSFAANASSGSASNSSSSAEDAKTPRPLRMLVPLKVNFQEFVKASDDKANFSGFSIDVFKRCVEGKRLYEFEGFGDGRAAPNYTSMLIKVQNKEYDGVVGDVTITAERMRMVDFTQPYIQTTLVMIQRNGWEDYIGLWTFLEPFSKELWACIVALVFATGLVLFIVEHDKPSPQEVKATWRAHLAQVFWFVALTLFFCHRSEMKSRLGKTITMFWLVVVLVLTSSYTASLTSLLTTKDNLHLQTFDDLKTSKLHFGTQNNSFVRQYVEKTLHIEPYRLKNLNYEDDYEESLQNNAVAAILELSPYAEIFLKRRCRYIAPENQIAYFGGSAFAFQKNSPFTNEISECIISLEQDGELQKIKNNWFGSKPCSKYSSSANIPITTFGGLFIIACALYGFSIFVRFFQYLQLEMCNKPTPIVPLEDIQIDF